MAILTQGTQIYFVDPADDSVVEVTGVTTFNPGGAPADQIDITNLVSQVKEFLPGLRTPGQASLEINADPTNASHVRLHELANTGTTAIHWAVGFSDGTATPTADSVGDFVLSGTRTWFEFDGYVADFPFDFATNSVVKTTISIQRTGTSTWTREST